MIRTSFLSFDFLLLLVFTVNYDGRCWCAASSILAKEHQQRRNVLFFPESMCKYIASNLSSHLFTIQY